MHGRIRDRWEDNGEVEVEVWNRLGKGSLAGCCKHGNELLNPLRSGELLDQVASLLASQGPVFRVN